MSEQGEGRSTQRRTPHLAQTQGPAAAVAALPGKHGDFLLPPSVVNWVINGFLP